MGTTPIVSSVNLSDTATEAVPNSAKRTRTPEEIFKDATIQDTDVGNTQEEGQDGESPVVIQVIDVGGHTAKYHYMIRHLLVDFGDYVLDEILKQSVNDGVIDQKFRNQIALVRQALIDPLRS